MNLKKSFDSYFHPAPVTTLQSYPNGMHALVLPNGESVAASRDIVMLAALQAAQTDVSIVIGRQSRLIATAAVLWLLDQRMSGGPNYHAADWRRIRQQRTRARQALSYAAAVKGAETLHWHAIGSRLVVCFKDGTFDYQVGQSANEELTNLMRVLVDADAEHVR